MATQAHEAYSPHQNFVEEINYNEIERLKIVGKGSFGVVWKAKWKGIFVAVKDIESEAERKAFSVEVRQLSRVSHPNIVRLYGACSNGPAVCLVMEYAEGGSLYNVLHCNPKPKYTAAHAMSWALQCAQGVAYLHAMQPKPLIHRDLKPPNLLLISGGKVLKICDFGTAADKSTYMTNNKGSAAWMAPEVFEGSSYTEKCDVFSWGIILWEVISRRKPFDKIGGNAFSIMWAVHKGQRPPLIENCPEPITTLMCECWHQQPLQRPSMANVVDRMIKLSEFFPGADKDLEYESDDYSTDAYEPDFSSSYEEQTQEIETNHNQSMYSTVNSSTKNHDSEMNETDFNPNSFWEHNKPKDNERNIWGRSVHFVKGDNGDYNASRSANGMTDSMEYSQPLQLNIDPNTWNLDPEVEGMELRKMAGFDKYMSVGNTGGTTIDQGTPDIDGTCMDDTDSDLDSMCLTLEPHLRPATPDQNSRLSMKIYHEHKQSVQEYLKVQTEIAYVSKHRSELRESLDDEQHRQQQEILKLEDEKESLVKLYSNLRKQLEVMQANTPSVPNAPNSHRAHDNDGWVIVPNSRARE
uniref:Mitogen-activated protein kinase kinase kinase 7 n=1 Tax=Xenopsylla cheopis TaxID=163159 RepID=A0A6M2DJQ0_XENCH